MQNFLRVDGTPKVEKEKTTFKSFIKARSWSGLFGGGGGCEAICMARSSL